VHDPATAARLTRGQFLKAAGAVALAGSQAPDALAAAAAPAPRFRSRPDLRPPSLSVTTASTAGATAPGYTFLGPSVSRGAQAGPLIVDAAGQPVWFQPMPRGQLAANFRVQLYRGKPVLTWWQGEVVHPGYGRGEGVILDTSYRQIARVRAARGRHIDLHEFLLTPQGTALVTCFPDYAPANLSSVGGPRQGHVYDSIIQEIDVRTGRLIMEWRGRDHVALSESYASPWGGFDFLHANSIDLTSDGHMLVSARHTWAVYKVHRRTGRVIWRLGGKRSNFFVGRAARFAWQHDAREPLPGVVTLFDDGEGPQRTESQSRGITLLLDSKRKIAHMTESYRHPRPLLASAMGSMQALPGGHVVIGWGTLSWMSEFTVTGQLVSDLRLPWGCQSYRGLRFLWSGAPGGTPAAAAVRDRRTGQSTLYASWNGSTAVAAWQVRVGPSASALRVGATVARAGFETAIPLGTATGYAAVTALDGAGRALGNSAPVRL
jgi:hypothetical protein